MRIMPYYHGDFWWVGGLFGLLITVAIIAGVVLVVRQLLERPHVHGGPPMAPPPPAPLSRAVEELDLRYARGEIDRNEYLQRRGDLMHGHAPGSPPLPPPGSTPPPPAPPA